MARRWTWWLLLWLSLFTGLIVWISLCQRPALRWPHVVAVDLTRGIITTDFTPSGYDYYPRQAVAWFWRSASRLVCLQEPGSHPSQSQTVEIDIETGDVDRRFLFLPHPIERPEAELFYWSVSPDGRFILTIARCGVDRIYTTARLDGADRLSWTHPYESCSEPAWLSDSSGFVGWPVRDGQRLARIQWIDSGATIELTLCDLPLAKIDTPEPLPHPHVLMTRWPPQPDAIAELLILSPTGDRAAWHRAAIPIPTFLAGEADLDAFVAPTGDRLLWLCHNRLLLPRPSRSHHFPFFSLQPQYRTTLLLSRSDGSQLTLFGRSAPGRTIDTVRWTPDGRKFGFLYEGTLWLASVDW